MVVVIRRTTKKWRKGDIFKNSRQKAKIAIFGPKIRSFFV